MNESDKRVIALQAALDLASDNAIETGPGMVRPWSALDVKNAAETFFAFLAPEYHGAKAEPKIRVAWRDETPDVVEFARGGALARSVGDEAVATNGKSLPATHGATPLVSTTVGKSPESLREMRARASEEALRKHGDLNGITDFTGNDTERF